MSKLFVSSLSAEPSVWEDVWAKWVGSGSPESEIRPSQQETQRGQHTTKANNQANHINNIPPTENCVTNSQAAAGSDTAASDEVAFAYQTYKPTGATPPSSPSPSKSVRQSGLESWIRAFRLYVMGDSTPINDQLFVSSVTAPQTYTPTEDPKLESRSTPEPSASSLSSEVQSQSPNDTSAYVTLKDAHEQFSKNISFELTTATPTQTAATTPYITSATVTCNSVSTETLSTSESASSSSSSSMVSLNSLDVLDNEATEELKVQTAVNAGTTARPPFFWDDEDDYQQQGDQDDPQNDNFHSGENNACTHLLDEEADSDESVLFPTTPNLGAEMMLDRAYRLEFERNSYESEDEEPADEHDQVEYELCEPILEEDEGPQHDFQGEVPEASGTKPTAISVETTMDNQIGSWSPPSASTIKSGIIYDSAVGSSRVQGGVLERLIDRLLEYADYRGDYRTLVDSFVSKTNVFKYQMWNSFRLLY
jgi:hypothetical protein